MKSLIHTFVGLTAFVVFHNLSWAAEPPADAVRLTADEVRANLTGSTEKWRFGSAAYYAPDGTFEAVWKGDNPSRVKATWWIEDDGTMCADVAEWGGDFCMDYWMDDGKIHYYYQDVYFETGYQKGRHLPD